MIYLVSIGILLLAAIVVTAIVVVNVRRSKEISGKHRLNNRPELPPVESFPEFKATEDSILNRE